MGKVKNLIWGEIEYDTEEAIQLHPETTPSWFREDDITPVPTREEIDAAHQASHEAFERFYADREAGRDTTESHAQYMSAIKLTCDLWFLKNQADLKGAPICSI